MSEEHDHGVAVEILAPEIEALRQAARHYAESDTEGAGLDLETAAIRYVRKLDDEALKARSPDYFAIFEAARRDQGTSDN